MLTSSKLRIAGQVIEYDRRYNRWLHQIGAYTIYVSFGTEDSDIFIQISKFGLPIGNQKVPSKQDSEYVEALIATMIRDFNAQNSIIEQWALEN